MLDSKGDPKFGVGANNLALARILNQTTSLLAVLRPQKLQNQLEGPAQH
jgi:hypothetical protein